MRSATLPLYKRWVATGTYDQIKFVDDVYALCEANYDMGGDTICECYTPEEILEEFPTIDEVKKLVKAKLEQATNTRLGSDDDVELTRYNDAQDAGTWD
jgi:hypothetical protein